jgi:hypothetical protein
MNGMDSTDEGGFKGLEWKVEGSLYQERLVRSKAAGTDTRQAIGSKKVDGSLGGRAFKSRVRLD